MPRLGLAEFPLEVELGIDSSGMDSVVRPQPKYRRIQRILLSGNRITSIPKCFEHLNDLRVLDMESNALKSFPGFACTAKIEYLNFQDNKLRQLPEEIGTRNRNGCVDNRNEGHSGFYVGRAFGIAR